MLEQPTNMQDQDLIQEQKKIYLFFNQVGGHTVLLKKAGDENVFKQAKGNELKQIKFPLNEGSINTYHKTKLRLFRNLLDSFLITTENNQCKFQKFLIQIKMKIFQNSIGKTNFQGRDYLKIKNVQYLQNIFYKVYIKLEDLTSEYTSPCVLDLKMGFTPQNEKDQLKYENSTSGTLGFRICGMKIQRPEFQIFKDKYWGRNLNEDQLKMSLAAFLSIGKVQNEVYIQLDKEINLSLVKRFKDNLLLFKDAISDNYFFRWVSSSLLIVYDSHQDSLFQLKLIDFANVEINENFLSPDLEMIKAVDNMIKILSELERSKFDAIYSFFQ